jgi:hypothetical protein
MDTGMRLEQIPLFIGIVVAILGLGLVLDAQLPEGFSPSRERRRRERTERHRGGETLVGLGIIAMAAALIGRDTWRFGTVSVIIGVSMLAIGAWLNREYLKENVLFRGAARRGEKRSAPRADEVSAPVGRKTAGPSVHVEPGLADSPPPRAPSTIRGDREAPIMTAADGVRKGDQLGEDTPTDGHPRLRIR